MAGTVTQNMADGNGIASPHGISAECSQAISHSMEPCVVESLRQPDFGHMKRPLADGRCRSARQSVWYAPPSFSRRSQPVGSPGTHKKRDSAVPPPALDS